MSTSNEKFIDESWEIVSDGETRFIGAVVDELANGFVNMRPALEYLGRGNMGPDGKVSGFRAVIPYGMMPSSGRVPIKVRATHRVKLSDYDQDDQNVFDGLIFEAFKSMGTMKAERLTKGLTERAMQEAREFQGRGNRAQRRAAVSKGRKGKR